MGVEVDGQIKPRAQRFHQGCRRFSAKQTCHVFDGQNVCSALDNLLCQAEVVVQGVEVLCRVRKVARVTQPHLRKGGASLENGIDSGPHVGDIIERIKDAEYVYSSRCGLLDKSVGHL